MLSKETGNCITKEESDSISHWLFLKSICVLPKCGWLSSKKGLIYWHVQYRSVAYSVLRLECVLLLIPSITNSSPGWHCMHHTMSWYSFSLLRAMLWFMCIYVHDSYYIRIECTNITSKITLFLPWVGVLAHAYRVQIFYVASSYVTEYVSTKLIQVCT